MLLKMFMVEENNLCCCIWGCGMPQNVDEEEQKNRKRGDFPGGPVVKSSCFNAGSTG